MIDNNIALVPYPDIAEAEPLPPERTWERLLEDGMEDTAEYVKGAQRDAVYRERIAEYQQGTLVIEWDRVPGARWAFNLPEGPVSSAQRDRAQAGESWKWDRSRWEREGDQSCSIVYESDRGSLRCSFEAGSGYVDYSLRFEVDSDAPWHDVYSHGCFNHCWADGFGPDAYVLVQDRITPLRDIPNPHGIWLRAVTLKEEPKYGELKRQQVSGHGPGGTMRPVDGAPEWSVREKIPLDGAQGRFIATTRSGEHPLTVAINSPQAIGVSWSPWPCTDIDLAFGEVLPNEPKTISGRISLLTGALEEVLGRVVVGQDSIT